MLKLSIENKMLDIEDLNKFKIGDEVIADACSSHDRFEGVIVGIELSRLYGSDILQPDITLLHDGYLTDGFKPSDLRKAAALAAAVEAKPVAWTTETNLAAAKHDPELALTMWGKPTGSLPVALYRGSASEPEEPRQ